MRLNNCDPILAAIFVLAFLTAATYTFAPHWTAIDDAYMCITASGFGGAPSEYIKWMHFLIGLLLKWLYLWNKEMPWFGLFHLLVHFYGLTVIYCLFLATRRRSQATILFSIFLITCYWSILTNLQFTSTAFVAAQAGFLCLLACFEENMLTGRSRSAFLGLGIFGLIVTFMIRWRVAEITLLLTALLGIIRHVPKERRKLLHFAVVIALTFFAGELVHATNVHYYEKNPRWSGFFEWHYIVNEFADFAHIKPNPEVLKGVGWTENDFKMMNSFIFPDAKIFNNTKARVVVSKCKDPFAALANHQMLLRETSRLLSDPYSLIAIVAILSFLFCGLQTRQERICSLLFLSAILFLDGCLIAFLKFPQYIYLPLWGLALLQMLFFTTGEKEKAPSWLDGQNSFGKRAIFPAISCLALVIIGLVHKDTVRKAHHSHLTLLNEIGKIKPRADQLYLHMPNTLPVSDIGPFQRPQAVLADMNISPAMFIFPRDSDKLQSFGINDFESMLGNPNIFYLSSDYMDSIQLLSTFCLQHYGKHVDFVETYHSQSLHFRIFKARIVE